MAEAALPPSLTPDATARFAEFARACKAAARAVALYPGSHPAIGTSLSRLVHGTARLAENGPFKLQVRADSLLLDGALPHRPDSAIAELAEVLYRHMIGALTVNAAADADSWRTLLLLLARTPEEVRGDGGIGRLWATAGGPSLEIIEIDYAEVLREKQGAAATIDQIIAAAIGGPQIPFDDQTLEALVAIVGDPRKLEQLLAELDTATAAGGLDAKAAAFLKLLRGLAEYVSRTSPRDLDNIFKQVGLAAGKFSADDMMTLLAQRDRPEAMSGNINVVGAMTDRMSDGSVAQFVAGSIIAERGATDRLAHAFQALVPERDRQRQLLALAETEVAASELGAEENYEQLWGSVEGMMTSYSDESFVSSEYGKELTSARARAVEVERAGADPPDRIALWLATVNDGALRFLDHRLLLDLLAIEEEPLRWRDVAQTVVAHADDLVRVGYFDQAWELVEAVVDRAADRPDREAHARTALQQFGGGSMMKHVAAHLRGANDDGYGRFKRICHAMGTVIIGQLAEALSTEQDARARRRLRDILVGFGAQGRESVQQLMNAKNWEVRRTAAYLLREFGGIEGLRELVPLLRDTEPLVQREAVQGLVMNGSDEASAILLQALTTAAGRTRETLVSELLTIRVDRAAPLFGYLIRRMERRKLPKVYIAAVEALGTFATPTAAEALKFALLQREWWAPMRTRRIRAAAAGALREIGTPEAVEILRAASARGPRGVRVAARAELARLA